MSPYREREPRTGLALALVGGLCLVLGAAMTRIPTLIRDDPPRAAWTSPFRCTAESHGDDGKHEFMLRSTLPSDFDTRNRIAGTLLVFTVEKNGLKLAPDATVEGFYLPSGETASLVINSKRGNRFTIFDLINRFKIELGKSAAAPGRGVS